jgi:hypothetical protein
MRKLILSATIVASSFLSYAQWRGVDNFGELREGVKAIKYSNKKQAMKKASDLFYTMGYSSDISHMYINKNVPVLGYFVEDGLVYGLIVTKQPKGVYHLVVFNHENKDMTYYRDRNSKYGYSRD